MPLCRRCVHDAEVMTGEVKVGCSMAALPYAFMSPADCRMARFTAVLAIWTL